LKDLPLITDPNLIAGMEHAEDAGVYQLRDDLAIIQTVDFFTPIVDDPYIFGQIAATNALSDVYAMGGKPLTAMNIVCFPIKTMPLHVLRDVLRGGMEKLREAGALLVGGHSVEDNELKYGLSVTGVVHPDRVLLNRGAKPGDKLILTKALGTGIVGTALKEGMAGDDLLARSVSSMTTLNKKAAELLEQCNTVHACTDVTGFGFLGHASEMIDGTEVGFRIEGSQIPYFPGLQKLIEEDIIPGGLLRNKRHGESLLDIDPLCPEWLVNILFDPQTAGGLLVALDASEAEELVKEMHKADIRDAAIVGSVTSFGAGRINLVF
jgi:selenide,water dikinase